MHTTKTMSRLALSTLLGLALAGTLSASPAFADHDSMQMAGDKDKMFDPAPFAYPQAAPGGVHLYHWKDYTETQWETGSVPDKRWELRHTQERARRERMKQQEGMSDGKMMYHHTDGSVDWYDEDKAFD